MISELIFRFSGDLEVVSLDASESRINWKFAFELAFCLYSFMSVLNICADEIEILPSIRSWISIFADSRDDLSITFPCWSYMVTPSMITLLSSPMSTWAISTFDAILPLITLATALPMSDWMAGILTAITNKRYRPNKVHTTIPVICLTVFTIYNI